jgi:CRP-like cAMP-binding protein
MWKKRLGYDETVFMESLPENLRTEVALHLKEEVIEKISLFKNVSNEFKREISLLLKPIFLTPRYYVFKAGDYGEEMYFVVHGELSTLTQKEDKILTTLKAGDYFGEIALFKNKHRSTTVKAISYCDIYVLDKKAFDKVISKYPEFGIKIQKQVEIRESRYMV